MRRIFERFACARETTELSHEGPNFLSVGRTERPAEHATARQSPAASSAAESDASGASCKTNVSYVAPEEDPTRRMRWSDYLAARAEGALADVESMHGSAYGQGESSGRNGSARRSAASGMPVGTVCNQAAARAAYP
ncbi:hypothetical protein WOLCODRAFT_153463 [Wolfiporia cocos MD-104 SS10]|uniref:Uncharacterized protein n=1 Tax=Wolfiporia cocos (strain MD-104) TaxID=742152 RepID=A0A2H3JZV1_WOLCO|nr:hypothetical protein WOLCODRAFT_153463 [Wolfiporia cocos MD-104 SS10]